MPLEVILAGFRLEDYIKDEFREKLEKVFEDKYTIRISELEIILVSKELAKKFRAVDEELEEIEGEIIEGEKVITINIRPPTFDQITFRHRGESEYQEKLLLVSSNNDEVMSNFLESYKDVLKHE